MSSLAEARPSGKDRGKSGRRTWYELRITEESSHVNQRVESLTVGREVA